MPCETNTRSQILGLVVVFISLPTLATAQSNSLPLTHGITGDEQGLPARLRPSAVLEQRAIQEVLLDVARAPRDGAYINSRLATSGYTADDLVSGGYLRKGDSGTYHIGFTLFTQDDLRKIRTAVEKEARSLADDYLAHQGDFQRTFRAYPTEQIPTLTYIALGCFSLDWDGLDVIHAHHYATLESDLGRPVVWAEERGELNLKGIYWGSHNDSSSGAVFTSFGDHYSLPRMALPDLYWRMGSAAGRIEADAKVKEKLAAIQHRAWDDVLNSAATILFALRGGPQSEGQLLAAAGGDHARPVLDLLVELDYVRCAAGQCSSLVPILTEQDRSALTQARELSRGIMEQWLARNYELLQRQLNDLTPIREGVPYPQVFTQIWHYVFGLTNGELVRRGLFADPYAASRKFKGFIPVVWKETLDSKP